MLKLSPIDIIPSTVFRLCETSALRAGVCVGGDVGGVQVCGQLPGRRHQAHQARLESGRLQVPPLQVQRRVTQ